SDVPCTAFLDTYGFGDPSRGGNLGEAVASTLVYFYSAEQDISDDAFLTDVVSRLETGEVATELVDVLIDDLLNYFIQEELFGTLRLNLSALFPKGTFGHLLSVGLDCMLKAFLFGNNTFKNIVNIVFRILGTLKIIPYKSVNDILYSYMDEYLTLSQLQEIDGEIQSFIVSLSTDENPATYSSDGVFFDKECAVAANVNGGYEVEATIDNLRLPALVSSTFGNSASNRKNISWFTKATVTGSDYCLTESSAYLSGGFTEPNTLPSGVTASVQIKEVTRQYPGVDFGIAGIFNYTFAVQRHMITFSGLKPGATYYYRVGDAEKGFWSEPAVIKTAGDSNSVTFFHVADPQSGLEKQYDVFGKVLDTAYSMYPEAAFMLCTGDHVDHGDNFKQWKWMFSAARDEIMNGALMPAAGNHEGKGTKAINNYFTLPYYADQNTEDGVFYSFEYNNAHFIVLNTENLGEDKALSEEQLSWLKKDASGSSAQWKILAFHKAIYSNGSHFDDDDVVALRKQLCALLPQLGIDVVLQGHDHVYLRTSAMNSNKVVKVYSTTDTLNGKQYDAMVNPDGTVYCITACSGVKYYKSKSDSQTDKLFPRAAVTVDTDYPVFSAYKIVNNKLYFDAYGVDPETGETTCIDSYEIIKDPSIDTPKFNDSSCRIFSRS
ncbi:MAG: metallophosphoesterase, partial [Clostridia bacterium]|nr:metallophosphoesterase [Clostridia bacterium]